MSDFSSFLFAKPSLVEGAARIFDFAGGLNQYNTSPSGRSADHRSINADWAAVGNDILESARQEAGLIKSS